MQHTRFDLAAVQAALRSAGLDAWLFYDFRGSDPIARKILGLDRSRPGPRRWFYSVPASGEPRKLVHAIEPKALAALPGEETVYLSWQSLREGLERLLRGVRRVAMQYSPGNEVPYVSRADAGTVEAVRAAGVEVVTSADLVQLFDAVLDESQLQSHLRAAVILRRVVVEVFERAGELLRAGQRPSERGLLAFAQERIAAAGLIYDHAPIVAVNEHAADPHFEVPAEGSAELGPGDLLLFDLWAKESAPGSIYADITWCAYAGEEPEARMAEVFDVVRRARDAVVERADGAFRRGEELRGFELDQVARRVVTGAGYGEYFIHRTGHSIHEETHGNGANLDDLETHDTRLLLPRTLFSVEPGIYLPGRFGVRTEIDVFHTGSGAEVTGGSSQERLVPLLGDPSRR
jgi:Xaa-Pro dipeptidase